MLARRTQLFGLKADLANQRTQEAAEQIDVAHVGVPPPQVVASSETIRDQLLSFPPLLWVVEDFFQDLKGQTCTQWLHRLLDAKKRDAELQANTAAQKSSLSSIFPSIECHTMFLPHTDKEKLRHLDRATPSEFTKDYLDDLERLKTKLFSDVQPKKKSGTSNDFADGPALSSLLRLLVYYANHGTFPAIPSIWNGFLEIQRHHAVTDSVQQFKDEMDQILLDVVVPDELPLNSHERTLFDDKHRHHILSQREFQKAIDENRKKAENLLNHLLFGMEDVYKPALVSLNVS